MTNEYCDFLMHHGILGQKWGVRRYQNEDGSRTSAGKKRYNIGNKIKGIKEKTKNLDKDQIMSAKIVAKSSKEGIDATKSTISNVISRHKKSDDPSKLSDAELNARVKRLQQEENYRRLTTQSSKGERAVNDILEIAGGVTALAASGLGIAVAIKQLKSKT